MRRLEVLKSENERLHNLKKSLEKEYRFAEALKVQQQLLLNQMQIESLEDKGDEEEI